MKKFSFRLQTVLNIKEQKEEKLKNELLQINALKAKQELLLRELDKAKKQKGREKQQCQTEGTSIERLVFFEKHIQGLIKKIEDTEKKIQELNKLYDKKRQEVIQATKEKKIFEKLKERDFRLFNKAVSDAEQKSLDEIAISKYNRKEQHNF